MGRSHASVIANHGLLLPIMLLSTSLLLIAIDYQNSNFYCDAFAPQVMKFERMNNGVLFVDHKNTGRLLRENFQLLVSSSSTNDQVESSAVMNEDQKDFFMGYLNKHHSDLMVEFVNAFTEVGAVSRKRNAFSRGSFVVSSAKLIDVSLDSFEVEAEIKERNKAVEIKKVEIDFDADLDPNVHSKAYRIISEKVPVMRENAVDDNIRRLVRLSHIVKRPEVTGKLIQLGIQIGGKGTARLEENLYLNNVPHNRLVRKYFYDMACKATLDAVVKCSEGSLTNRMQLTCLFPELNTSMDAYRIGTLLELARSLAITLAEQNLRVRVCVQGSMGTGIFTAIPKQLSGVATLLQRMDWESQEGEENEGMVGNYVNFGGVGKEHVVDEGVDRRGNEVHQDDVFIIICPQSMVGTDTSIYGSLSEHVQAAGDRPVILINPDLTDKVSAAGQQSVRGRSERIAFQKSFEPIFHFQCNYVSGTSYFPILGATCRFGASEPWIVYQRRDRANDGGEVYLPILSDEVLPDSEMIMKVMKSQ